MKKQKVQTKKISLAAIENRLTLKEMENIMAGSGSNACSQFTGFMCGATVILAFSPLAPLAGGTGFACATGLLSGCH